MMRNHENDKVSKRHHKEKTFFRHKMTLRWKGRAQNNEVAALHQKKSMECFDSKHGAFKEIEAEGACDGVTPLAIALT